MIELLKSNIEELQGKLIHEDDFLSEERVKDMKRQVEEYLKSNPIGYDGNKDNLDDGDREQDIFGILKQNQYSGVKGELKEVML